MKNKFYPMCIIRFIILFLILYLVSNCFGITFINKAADLGLTGWPQWIYVEFINILISFLFSSLWAIKDIIDKE